MSQTSDNNRRIAKNVITMERDTYFDFLRGIAIIMVICIHTYTDGLMHFNLCLRQLLNCAVPIFLAISGYFIGHKSFLERNSYIDFLKKQVVRVYVPMVLWSIPWFILALHHDKPLGTSIRMVFCGEMSMEIFYFVILIIQYYALTPLIQRANTQFGGGKYAVFITIVGIMSFDYILRIKGLQLPLSATAGLFPVWMIFYVMGVLKAQNLEFPYKTKKPLLGALIAIVLCGFYIVLLHHISGNLVPGIKLTAHIYSFFVVMWLFTKQARLLYKKIENKQISKHIILIGKYSFFIYLTHFLILYVFNYLEIPAIWSLQFILCVILSYIIAIVFNGICPRAIKKYIGF